MRRFVDIFESNWKASILLWLAIAFILYGNTIKHDFALDDDLVLVRNEHVLKGFEGIGQMFSHSHTHGFNQQEDQGYRPLPLTVNAVGVWLMDLNPSYFHLINVLAYGLLLWILFSWLKRYVKILGRSTLWLASLIFMVSPVHTEVVANVKGLEDILMSLFTIVALLFTSRYIRDSKKVDLLYALLGFSAALLCKETALSALALVPLVVWLLEQRSIKTALSTTAFFLAPVLLYFGLRLIVLRDAQSMDLSVMNNALVAIPNGLESLTTKLWIQVRYLQLFVFPLHLISDYSFNSIPSAELASFRGAVAWIAGISAIGYTIWGVAKKQVIGFGLAWTLLTVVLVSNIFFLIGSTMAERFLFLPSVGLSIAAGYALSQLPIPKKYLQLICLTILIGYAARTIARNQDWANTTVLVSSDVKLAPSSTRLQLAMGSQLLKQAPVERSRQAYEQTMKKAQSHLQLAIDILPSNYEAWYNLGVIYQQQGELETAVEAFESCLTYAPNYALAHNNIGVIRFNGKAYDEAQRAFEKAYANGASNPQIVSNMGLVPHQRGQLELAIKYYKTALALDPTHLNSVKNLTLAYQKLGDEQSAQFYKQRYDQLSL